MADTAPESSPTTTPSLRNHSRLFTSQPSLFGIGVSRPQAQLAVTAAQTYLPGNFVSFRVVLKGDWEVSTLIKFSECRGLGWPLFKCPCSWRAPHLEEGENTL